MSRSLTCLYTIYRKYDCFIKGHMQYLLNRHCTHCIHQLHIHVNSIYLQYTYSPSRQSNKCTLSNFEERQENLKSTHTQTQQSFKSSNIKYITIDGCTKHKKVHVKMISKQLTIKLGYFYINMGRQTRAFEIAHCFF